MYRRQAVTCCVCVCVLVAASQVSTAGDLNPQPGAIGPTMKPLDKMVPAKDANSLSGSATATILIDQPGVYMLTANVVGEAGKSGIEITASHVTIDLNGFTIDGQNAGVHGIFASVPGLKNIRLRNGTVLKWGQVGVNLENVDGAWVHYVCSILNGDDGYRFGKDAYCEAYCADDNGRDGLNAGDGLKAVNGRAGNNVRNGITATKCARIKDHKSDGNGNDGVNTTDDTELENVISTNSGNNGTTSGNDATYKNVKCPNNANHGVHCADRFAGRRVFCKGNGNTAVRCGQDSQLDYCNAQATPRAYHCGLNTTLNYCKAYGGTSDYQYYCEPNCRLNHCDARGGYRGYFSTYSQYVSCKSSGQSNICYSGNNNSYCKCVSRDSNTSGQGAGSYYCTGGSSYDACVCINSKGTAFRGESNARYFACVVRFTQPPVATDSWAYKLDTGCVVDKCSAYMGWYGTGGINATGAYCKVYKCLIKNGGYGVKADNVLCTVKGNTAWGCMQGYSSQMGGDTAAITPNSDPCCPENNTNR